jgi:hypothetical protein
MTQVNILYKFVQLAVASNAENGEALYALDSNGAVWKRVHEYKPAKYARHPTQAVDHAKGITEENTFITGRTAGWRKVAMEISEPVYHEEDPRHGLPQK